MVILPPGKLLQLMHLRERLDLLEPGRFLEIGPGTGNVTHLLLAQDWRGRCFDRDETTTDSLKNRYSRAIASGQLEIVHGDFLSSTSVRKADMIISCWVMEHLDSDEQSSFMQKAAESVRRAAIMIALVPSSTKHWVIEDDIAGHYRRYIRQSISTLIEESGWSLRHIAGLTFPISNIFLPLSNHLVRRSETNKLSLSLQVRTRQSGRRSVKFKTEFPKLLGLPLNRYTMFPAHLMQKMFARSERSLVLFFEAEPSSTRGE